MLLRCLRWQLGNRHQIDDFDNLYKSRRFKDGNPKAVYYETETISFQGQSYE